MRTMTFAFLCGLAMLPAGSSVGATGGAPAAPAAPAVSTTTAPAAKVDAALQEDVLARAVFLARRDVCLFVEADAPEVTSWDTDSTGGLARQKTQVPHCDATAPLHALLHAGATALALAHARQPPPPTAGPFALEAIDAAFVALVGRPLVRASEPTKTAGESIHTYDAAAIEAAFRALYVRPTETRLGVPLQKLFDAVVKDEIAIQVRDLELLTKNRVALANEARKLIDGAKKGKGAQGRDAWRAALNRLVASDDHAANIDPRLVGFALRRQADGTLDTIVTCLRTVLSDYAPTSATPR